MVFDRGVPVFTAEMDGDINIQNLQVPPEFVLILGHETKGLPEAWSSYGTSIAIPIADDIDSLGKFSPIVIFEVV